MGERKVGDLSEFDADFGVIARFRDVVAAQGDAVAVIDDAGPITFNGLARKAAGTLSLLRRRMSDAAMATDSKREPVGLLMGHDAAAVAGLVAALASGHPVIVLDVRAPAPRQRRLLETAGARVVLCDERYEATARDLVRDVVAVPEKTEDDPALLWLRPPDPRATACIAFTSGSTGTPKPVLNDHRLLVRDAWNSSIATGCYGKNDVLAHTLPIAFHAGLTTTVHGLVVGATMRLYDARTHGIAGLPEVIQRDGCTMMITSPAILRAFVAISPDPERLTTLRSLSVAGEAAYSEDVEAVRPFLPAQCVVRNRYGSSETGLIAEFPMRAEDHLPSGALPIGEGVGATVVEVVRSDGTRAAVGETGRLHVHAPVTATGYLDMPEATTAAFTHHGDGTSTYLTSDLGRRLEDGGIQIVGRVDHSVKVRGYLVDPGEIDAALFALPQVREAVVVGAAHPRENRVRLVAYVAPAAGSGTDSDLVTQVRMSLRASLPAHMVPEVIMEVDALPRSERGKIDRAALPPVEEPTELAPVTIWEQQIAGEWALALDLDRRIGPDEDFFALGGDSLAAEALIARLVLAFDLDDNSVSTSMLAESPTLREFAHRLQKGTNVRAETPGPRNVVVLNAEGTKTPIFFVSGAAGLGVAFMGLARRLGAEQPAYAFQSHVVEGRGLPDRSVGRTAARNLKFLRQVQPQGPYLLAGYSFGGLVALEMAHRLRTCGETVRLAILDSFPPDPTLQPDNLERHGLRRLVWHVKMTFAGLHWFGQRADAWQWFVHAGETARRYHGKPWPEESLLVLTESPEQEARASWGDYLPAGHREIVLACAHDNLLRHPNIDPLAEGLSEFFTHGSAQPAHRAVTLGVG